MNPEQPFTPTMAARAGIGRSALERLLRQGRIRRLLRGVYLDAAVVPDRLLRARALALVLGSQHLVIDRTAAWLHGADPLGSGVPVPLDLHGRRRHLGPAVPLGPDEVEQVGAVRVTTPVRTAFDVARGLAPERALVALDAMVRSGSLEQRRLLRAAAALGDDPGAARCREVIAKVDARAADAAESVLRLCWLEARMPTPTPGLVVQGQRLALGLPLQRFGVLLDRQSDPPGWPGTGWRVLRVDRHRVLAGDPTFLARHLEREFHRHLLEACG